MRWQMRYEKLLNNIPNMGFLHFEGTFIMEVGGPAYDK